MRMKRYAIFLLLSLPLLIQAQGLFESDSILDISLVGDIRALTNDRADEPGEHPLQLKYVDVSGKEMLLDISSRTRGNFRRKLGGCTYPPIMLLFHDKKKYANTLFGEQHKLKLVVPCKDDQYVAKEYLAYRIYNMLTPMSFRARLLRLTLVDTKRNKTAGPFYAMLLEEEDQLAKRNNMVSVERKIGPRQTDAQSFHRMAVFEYFIGNTDWSVEFLQNVKLLATDSAGIAHTVPYDFDHAGIVSAPYAKPAEELQLSSVKERRYRGYCLPDLGQLEPVFKSFFDIRDKVKTLYESASYLDEGSRRSALKYIDDFYGTISDPKKISRDFGYPCDKNGTGNIIIGGLKSNNE